MAQLLDDDLEWEEEYLRTVRDIVKNGIERDDRTGTGTIALFGKQMRFSLKGGRLPLLTTKKMNFFLIVGELLWFISGNTDSKMLSSMGIKIWDMNGSKDNLKKLGFGDREEGDLGPVYGFQWRHWGAEYKGCKEDYTGKGVDQLMNVINLIKNDPCSRRIVMSAWNPTDLEDMVLPPCHILVQFIVSGKDLTCILYQRSGDMGLGVPFNIASYALLTHIVAHSTGLNAIELIHNIGDAHVYLDHVDALKIQCDRTPTKCPTIDFNCDSKDITKYQLSDITLRQYISQSYIKMNMSL